MKQLVILFFISLAIAVGIAILCLSTIVSFFNSYYLLKFAIFYSLSIFLIYRIQRKHSFYLPSSYLFLLFSIVPVFGIPSYYTYMKLHSDFLGVTLNMKYALDLWLQGTFFVMLGIFLTHMIKRTFLKYRKSTPKPNTYISWNWKYFYYILLLLATISFAFTIAVLWKIGYIPILKGNIASERFSYGIMVGDWTFKLARLWLLVYLFTIIKLLRNIKQDKGFYVRKNIPLIVLLIFSMFLEAIYGDRFRHFVMFAFTIIMINKAIGRVRISYLVPIFIVTILLANLVVHIRDTHYRDISTTVYERAMLYTFSEFHSFAHVVQEYPESDFLHGKAFLGTLAPLLPKQVWAVFNIDKDELYTINSAAIMKEIYGHYAGIRIGIIGEGFINFGYLGVIFVPLLSGILFGILESIFISMRLFDVKEVIVAFAIALMMFLPIAQTNALVAEFPLNLYLIIGCIVLFGRRQIIGK